MFTICERRATAPAGHPSKVLFHPNSRSSLHRSPASQRRVTPPTNRTSAPSFLLHFTCKAEPHPSSQAPQTAPYNPRHPILLSDRPQVQWSSGLMRCSQQPQSVLVTHFSEPHNPNLVGLNRPERATSDRTAVHEFPRHLDSSNQYVPFRGTGKLCKAGWKLKMG